MSPISSRSFVFLPSLPGSLCCSRSTARPSSICCFHGRHRLHTMALAQQAAPPPSPIRARSDPSSAAPPMPAGGRSFDTAPLMAADAAKPDAAPPSGI
ncbi:hypothetical protein PVAP13_6NG098803 [Panicum virgatum]|uniref:Uncharacterized protein n=1 Tax=Panicum virgatum TaxID=38727 RepID=A0A8T0QVY3_PANVG|nr:hypothetical protein PVAP13_6NG098803 [Panicum virgatum]